LAFAKGAAGAEGTSDSNCARINEGDRWFGFESEPFCSARTIGTAGPAVKASTRMPGAIRLISAGSLRRKLIVRESDVNDEEEAYHDTRARKPHRHHFDV
jgi:hypothetical protein